MIMQMESPISVLRQHLAGERPMDETALSAVSVLAERLHQLKEASSMFSAISFSPEIEAIVEADMSAVN